MITHTIWPRPLRRLALAGAPLLLLGGCGDGDGQAAKPATTTTTTTTTTSSAAPEVSLAVKSPAPGTVLKGNVARLEVSAEGIQIVKADGDTSGRSGHFHVFIDRDPVAPGAVIPKEAGIVHTAENPITLPGLGVGEHRLTVVLGDGVHRRLGDAQAETTVKVTGPSLQATASATSAGQPVTVTIRVEGVTLAAADGDRSGRTGHLHLFVDREPTAPGQPIPKEAGIIHTAETTVEVSGLAPGEHVIWVVLGDGVHIPFDPLVADKVVVTTL